MAEQAPGLAATEIALRVNGRTARLAVDPRAPLLAVLRNDLGLNGPKYGCGLGECGACTVLLDGVAARACAIPLAGAAGRAVTTLEGLSRAPDGGPPAGVEQLHPVQRAFVETQAAQCGYCLNGMVMTTVALLARTPRPSEAQVRAALSHNLCRCGTHLEILAAVQRAAALLAEAAPAGAPPPVPGDRAHAALAGLPTAAHPGLPAAGPGGRTAPGGGPPGA